MVNLTFCIAFSRNSLFFSVFKARVLSAEVSRDTASVTQPEVLDSVKKSIIRVLTKQALACYRPSSNNPLQLFQEIKIECEVQSKVKFEIKRSDGKTTVKGAIKMWEAPEW